jgi:hypothetical protein
VFGGRDNYLMTYCQKRPWGAWEPRLRKLPSLRRKLIDHAWVLRAKKDVLPELPDKARFPMFVDVCLQAFNDAHTAVLDTVDIWLDEQWMEWDARRLPSPDDPDDVTLVESWCHGQIGLMSPLRKAAGLAKVPVAAEYVADWVAAEVHRDEHGHVLPIERPLLVWAHHTEVEAALVAAAHEAVGPDDVDLVRALVGATSERASDEAVADFQAGKVAVLIAGITAAGVGITLTRGSDMVFVETSYVVDEVAQAEDRQLRIGQRSNVTAHTMIAPGTLDERIQAVLAAKGNVLELVFPGGDNHVAVLDPGLDDLVEPWQVTVGLVWEAVARRSRNRRRRAA